MGTFKFSIRMLVKDYKKSLFYGLTLIFAVTVCFVFFNIINNPDLADQAIAKSGGVHGMRYKCLFLRYCLF